MDIQELTRAMNDFVEAKGWYKSDSKRPQTARNLSISLALEAAEVLEYFQWDDKLSKPEEFSLELADIALYLLQLAHVTGINLEQAILEKLQINEKRDWNEK